MACAEWAAMLLEPGFRSPRASRSRGTKPPPRRQDRRRDRAVGATRRRPPVPEARVRGIDPPGRPETESGGTGDVAGNDLLLDLGSGTPNRDSGAGNGGHSGRA